MPRTTGLSISDVVQRTGVAEGTLRMWERRHGFPVPQRLPSGHRRYTEQQVECVQRVLAGRMAGLSLAAAIERAQREPDARPRSLYAELRRRRPELEARLLPKRLLQALSHAIEDESLARAERPVLFGCFQREHFYRQAEPRWVELSRGSALAAVFADFPRARVARAVPAEIPVDAGHPLGREWAIVCDADRHAVCLVGREPPSSGSELPSQERHFETIWSVEPQVVRDAARICAAVADSIRPRLIGSVRERLDSEPSAPTGDQLRLAASITNRLLSTLASGTRRSSKPALT